jgi:integrase
MAKVKERVWTTKEGKTKSAWICDYIDGERRRRLQTFKRRKTPTRFLQKLCTR